ncbi:hypothetical protein [Spirillospora sp. NPDC029432]|uniref:hypothetical protein n=1 Tax=Spirillospora sp. NPDC029432 TaxID=3154599 RepID=UPI00345385EF
MDLLKSWGAALLVYLVGAFVSAALVINARAGRELTTVDGGLLWVALPTLLTFLLVTLIADRVHAGGARREPRGGPGRHALAALAVPVLVIVLGVAAGVAQRNGIGGVLLSAAASLLGTALGFFGPAMWRRRRGRAA